MLIRSQLSRKSGWVLAVLLAVPLILASCKADPTPAPTNPPTEPGTQEPTTPPPATTQPPEPSADASPEPSPTSQPARTPTPSGPTPEPFLEPALISQQPYPGEELLLNGSIRLTFNQPMNRASVESALSVEPGIDYTVEWADDSTLQILPAEGALELETGYTITVSDEAESAEGRPLTERAVVEVQTPGPLVVSEVIPANNSKNISADAEIMVIFNRPVVPLVIAENKDDLPQPLTFEPDIPGEGEWINTSMYLWQPSEPLGGGLEYTVTVTEGLTAVDGAVLEETASWSFTTTAPEILSVSPRKAEGYSSDEFNIPLDAEFRVEFNQQMDRQTTQAAFQLINSTTGAGVAGSFRWEQEDRVMIFKPSGRLALDSPYRVFVAVTATNSAGMPLKSAYNDTLTTFPYPAVERTYPANGDATVQFREYWYRDVSVYFNTLMNEASLVAAGRVTVEPALEDFKLTVDHTCVHYNPDDYSCSLGEAYLRIGGKFKPRTTYTITFHPGARDVYGNAITEPTTFSFTTLGLSERMQINLGERYGFYNASTPARVVLLTRNKPKVYFELRSIPTSDLDNYLDRGIVGVNSTVIREWEVEPAGPQDEVVISPLISKRGVARCRWVCMSLPSDQRAARMIPIAS